MENVKTVVQSALPGLTTDVLDTVLTCLQDCGVECVDDLALVEERDLVGCLKPIQIRKLLRSAKPEGTSVLEAAEFAVSAEGSLLFDGLSFADALSASFSTFFMLNMEYPSEAAGTMEFIQRCFAHINPDRGTKTQPKHGKKTHCIPAKVLRLVNQLGSFEWHTQQ